MIKPIRAWVDSEGVMHATPEAAAKAEFRKLLLARKEMWVELADGTHTTSLDVLVERMYELDKMFGEATREDSRADLGISTLKAPDA